jgi:hypothetical protein
MRTLGSPPPGSQASASRSATACRALARTTVLASKGSLRHAKNGRTPCFLRAVLPIDLPRRTAPPGSRCSAVSSSSQRRKPGCS